MKKFREFRKEQAKYDYGTPESVKLMKKVTPGQAAEARISYDNRLKNKIGRASDEPDGDDYSSRRISQQSHAVHVNGKKWKSFPSAAMANKAAHTIKDRHGKNATVHKESVEEAAQFKVDIEGLPPTFMQGRSSAEILAKLRKIVKQPSIIKDVERYTDMEVKKAYRQKAQGREVEEAKRPNPEDNAPASPDEKSMAIKQAEFIEYATKEIADHMKKNKEFPEWMQNKLSALHQKAKDMHSTLGAHDVDESAQIDEISADLAKSYYKKATAPDAYKAASDLGHTKDSMRKAHNRVVGSNKAMDRIYRRDKTYKKEEVNEISTDLKQRYAKKASSDINLTKKDLSIAKDMDVPDVKKKLKHRLQTRRVGVARATEPATSKNLLDAKCKK